MKDSTNCIVPSCKKGRREGGKFCLECGEIRDAMIAAMGEIKPDEVMVLIERFLQHPQCLMLWNQAVGDQARMQLVVEKFFARVLRESGRSKVVKADDEDQVQWGRNDGGDGEVYTRRKSGKWIKQRTGVLLTLAQMTKLDVVWRKLRDMRS